MLRAHDAEDHTIEALESGADDCVAKPFHLRELTARIRASIRRTKTAGDCKAVLAIGAISLDPSRHEVTKNGQRLHLTPKQFDLLRYLMKHAGGAIPHERLLRSVWGPEYGDEFEYLRTFIRQLRVKTEDDPAKPKYLTTDSHFGYRFEVDNWSTSSGCAGT
jgi:two-component system KDP operon response regulator KdpE